MRRIDKDGAYEVGNVGIISTGGTPALDRIRPTYKSRTINGLRLLAPRYKRSDRKA
jgi:hypothetical protein